MADRDVKPEDISDRDLIAAGRAHDTGMDKAPWYSAESRWQSDCVLTGAPDADMTNDGRVVVQANSNFPYRANLDGIAWMRSNLAVLLDGYAAALDDADRLRSELDSATLSRSVADARSDGARSLIGKRNDLMLGVWEKLGSVGEQTPAAVAKRLGAVVDAVRLMLSTAPAGVTWPELEALRKMLGGG